MAKFFHTKIASGGVGKIYLQCMGKKGEGRTGNNVAKRHEGIALGSARTASDLGISTMAAGIYNSLSFLNNRHGGEPSATIASKLRLIPSSFTSHC